MITESSENHTSGKFSKNELRRRSRTYLHRQCRIIIRNLSYKITENMLRSEFERFGNLEEVNILKREDGKLVGCAFLQFSQREESDRAIQEMDSHIFMGRKIEVHYAKDKADYSRIKKEKIKEEDAVKIEDDDGVQIKEEEDDDDDDEDDEDEDDYTDDDDENEDDDIDEDVDEKPPKGLKSSIKKEKRHNEVEEEREVFVKNLPYEVDASELMEIMSQFGKVEKALINKERISGHSKGTAFVIFRRKDSAEISCRQSLKLRVHDQYIEIMPALRKADIMNREKVKQAKDSRNLYLLKEGLIMAGSPAAKDVSKGDMAQRLRLEQRSNEMLKNFNRFVSRERLTIHNLPQSYTNEELRKMIIKNTSCKPKECRVMQENRQSFGNAMSKSRGYGFVSFAKHEIALEVLRKLNNNPAIFGKNSRPIVSFSIEDRIVYNIRQKRLEKSRLNNPTYQKKMEELKAKRLQKAQSRKETRRNTLEQLAVAPVTLLQKLNAKSRAVDLAQKKKQRKRDVEETPFAGELAQEGKKGIRSTRKISIQAKTHLKRINQERKEEKKKRTKQEHARNRKAKEGVKKVKPKMNISELKKEDAFFKEAIGKYKNMISQVNKKSVRSKWYSE
ncbi:RNA-binding protein 28 [Anopheles marshallii]|uniref:RNA-binding protein 28 n=1 Tax=Anopheles marshallii TaxID=1521116 RepID=UPI00237B50C8|nr:RNA-binding protein 28 [Anopheles marshallii]